MTNPDTSVEPKEPETVKVDVSMLLNEIADLKMALSHKETIIRTGKHAVTLLNKMNDNLRAALVFHEQEWRKIGREDVAETAAIMVEQGS